MQYNGLDAIQWSQCNTMVSMQYNGLNAIQWTRCNTVVSMQYNDLGAIQWSQCNTMVSMQYNGLDAIQWSCNGSEESLVVSLASITDTSITGSYSKSLLLSISQTFKVFQDIRLQTHMSLNSS